MLTTETQQFARVLTDKLAELTNQRQGRDRIAVETSPDEVEECLLAADRDIALMDLGRMSSTCRQIRAALKRIRDESFGICTRCEREIGQRRLQVIPWAALCVRCQEALEREDGNDGDQFLPGGLTLAIKPGLSACTQIPRGNEKTGPRLHGVFWTTGGKCPTFPRSSPAQRSYGFDREHPPFRGHVLQILDSRGSLFLVGDSKGDVHCPG